jgi:dihydrofolate reductase
MSKLIVFESVTLDGYFAGPNGDVSWAHDTTPDPEWSAFIEGNASGESRLLFGRVTYDMMNSYWPTPMAEKNDPVVAERMNNLQKVVFSRTMTHATWKNTRVLNGDIVEEVRKLKDDGGPDMAILGSGSIASQLAAAGLIDEFQLVMFPIVLGGGRRLFEAVAKRFDLALKSTRRFASGRVVLFYEPKT